MNKPINESDIEIKKKKKKFISFITRGMII